MKDMDDVRLHFNRISGSIPEKHFSMSELERWNLYDTNLTGTLSTKIGQELKSLQTFRIRRNTSQGTIPTELGEMLALAELGLHQNELAGTVPLELCSLRGPKGITLLDADCGPTNRVGEPLVGCSHECCAA